MFVHIGARTYTSILIWNNGAPQPDFATLETDAKTQKQEHWKCLTTQSIQTGHSQQRPALFTPFSNDDENVLYSLQWMDLAPSSGAITVVVMSLTTRALQVDISTSAIGLVRTPPHVSP